MFKKKSSRAINELPRPRVLVYGVEDEALMATLSANVESSFELNHSSSVSFDEWDCVITGRSYTSYEESDEAQDRYSDPEVKYTWEQNYPPHISIIHFAPVEWSSRSFLDFIPPKGDSYEAPRSVVAAERGISGRHLSYVEGLPGYIDELVKESLVPVVNLRDRHIVFYPASADGVDVELADIRPFLYGPSDNVLAGSYQRAGGKGSVWLLPGDLENKADWVLAAFKEWNSLYPDRFPGDVSWKSSPLWRSVEESGVHAEILANDQLLKEAQELHKARNDELKDRLSEASAKADRYERALVATQDDLFQSAVYQGLVDLGFRVRDMDLEWPSDARKEDYRISDDDDEGWICIGEAKGFGKGVSEVGLASLNRWVEFYLAETGGTRPSARWYIANHQINRDPLRRQKIFPGRTDVVDMFGAGGGLIIEGRALLELVRCVHVKQELKTEIRSALRSMTGLLDADRAAELIAGVSS
ncbi:hypothetical protein [Lentzea sp. CA-135723]|uniref:hypothetical protein n=1 Tax=Lentzea sp. CA-135723 TaxID=3239950 RepID=UPI003D901DDF